MSALMPQGLRDCLTLSLSVHGTTWTSSDGRLSVGVTERITRTAQDFVARQSGSLGVDNPADDALFKALLKLTNADAIDATTANPDLNRMLGALMETLVGGPALDAVDLAEHMREFQMLGLKISDEPRPEGAKQGLDTLPAHLAHTSDLKIALLYFLVKGYFADRIAFPNKIPQREKPKVVAPVKDGQSRPDLDALATSYQSLLAEQLAAHTETSNHPFRLDDPKMLTALSKQVRQHDVFIATPHTSHKDTQKYFGKNAPERLRERAIIQFINSLGS